MATSKSIRRAPGRARRPAFRRSAPSRPRCRPGNGSLAAPPPLPLEEWRRLTLVVPRLRGIYGTAVTVERALRQQEAELDPEIADCLRYGVCDPIADQIRALEEVTAHSSGTDYDCFATRPKDCDVLEVDIEPSIGSGACGARLSGGRAKKRRVHRKPSVTETEV